MPLARSLGVPLIVTLHGADITVRNARSDRYKHLAESAACVVCVSKFVRDRALEAGFPTEKLTVHYIGIDRELFAPSGVPVGIRKVLFVGRLVEKKGCEYLLRAMQLVQREQTDCELTIIGDGPLRSSLEVLARDLKLHCDFCGVQPAPIVRDLLQKSRVFCVPSVTAANGDSEGLGLVFAEAQSMGVPVVSTLHGGIPEIVSSGETGFLVPERAPQVLAEALSTLLADESIWQRFHEAAQVRIRDHFDIRVQTQLLEGIYDRLLGARV